MEPCPTPSCAMGIAKEGTEPARGGGSPDLSIEPQFGNPLWKGPGEAALELPVSAGVGLREAEEAALVSPVESCLQEEWPGAEGPSGRKRPLEEVEEDRVPMELQKPAEEEEEDGATLPSEAKGELFAPAAPTRAGPRKMAAPSRRKRSRGRKPLKKAALCRASVPTKSREEGEGPGPSQQHNPSLPPGRVPKKRGRKSKAELLLLKLSQEAESRCPQRTALATEEEEEEEDPESTPGRRPKRRAAKVALMYLQELAEELTSVYQAPSCAPAPEDRAQPRQPRGAKRRGRKPKDQKWEQEEEEDVDFVPAEEGLLQGGVEEEEEEEQQRQQEEEEEEEEEHDLLLREAFASDLEPEPPGAMQRPRGQGRGFAPNGLHKSVMAPVWTSLSVTHRLRECLHSPWEFPEWVPSALQWVFLSDSQATDYLPGETKSPFFSIWREGLQEDWGIRYRINRFNSLQPHEERLDTTFFVGGPVWALEWCPTPEGSCASQCVALYCNPGMDDRHTLAGTYTGPALLQLWELGPIQQGAGSATKPELAYAIATDHGCIWDMKFCPSGGWEPPDTCRVPPQMSRLGLLAVAFSDGQVLIYSLPHAEALQAHWRAQVTGEGTAPWHAICKVQHVVSLQVGSVQAGNALDCGQCFSLAWMSSKPHHHLAAGFYDGTVALWNLTSKSLLQRVRQPDGSLKLYPFRCFLAHDHAVRHIQWCKANSHFMVTAGNDRKVKFWDLRRLHEPLNSIKRFLSTEMAWLLPYSGVTVAQDNCYASYGLCGIHYLDAGYLGFRAYFVAPRKGTVWSISGSDWLNTVAAGDVTGELVAAMMPDLSINPQNIKRPSERRFPVYKAALLPCSLPSKDAPLVGPTERSPMGGRTYGESVAQNYILFQDPDLRSFQNVFRQKAPRKHPHLLPETKEGEGLGRLQLEAIHKVRFSPNLDCHTWLVSGGQSGLVRLHCLRALASPPSHKLQRECQAQFSAMFHREGESNTPARSPPPGGPAEVS